MKRHIYILLLFISSQLFGQSVISGQLFDLTTQKKIYLRNNSEKHRIWLSDKGKMRDFVVDSTGLFKVDLKEIEDMGDTLSFSVTNFNIDEMTNDYADFEIKNIPKKMLADVLSEIYLAKAYWIPSCGNDCFKIDARRTFKMKIVKIKTPNLYYYMIRNPLKMKKLELGAKYQTDLNKNVIK